MVLVSRNISLYEYSQGFPGQEAPNDSGVLEKRRCSDLSIEISDCKAHIIIQQYAVSRRLFSDPKVRDLE